MMNDADPPGQQLRGIDATFLYAETARAHMHTLKLLVLDVDGMPRSYRFDRLVSALASAVSRLPNWRSQIVFTPLDLDHPRWVPDPSFDINDHVTRVTLDSRSTIEGPGATTALNRLVSEILSTPLPRDRPLWHVTVAEGLEGGRVALIMKVHHCLADGVAFARVLRSMTSPLREQLLPPAPLVRSEDRPPALARRAWRGPFLAFIRRMARMPWLIIRTLVGDIRRAWLRRRTGESAAFLFRGPSTPLDRPLTPRRRFASASVSLSEASFVKNTYGTTVNDVVLSIVADALRGWVRREGIDESRPLIAGVPISTDTAHDEDRRWGTNVSHVAISLETNIEDPVQRLLSVQRCALAAKAEVEVVGHDLLVRWSELANPPVMRVVWRIVPHLPRPPINMVVSNVPGPKETRYFAGAEVVELYSVGPLLEGIGLNITAWTYRDRITFGVLTSPEGLRDPSVIADGIAPALERLVKLAADQAA
jgi:diacylglycerol O-acyltransferase / wax synthase